MPPGYGPQSLGVARDIRVFADLDRTCAEPGDALPLSAPPVVCCGDPGTGQWGARHGAG